MDIRAALIIAAEIVLATTIHGFFTRYELDVIDSKGVAYRIDPLTGKVSLCAPDCN